MVTAALIVFTVLMIIVGVTAIAKPRAVKQFVDNLWTSFYGRDPGSVTPVTNTPRLGGILVVIVGVFFLIFLITVGVPG